MLYTIYTISMLNIYKYMCVCNMLCYQSIFCLNFPGCRSAICCFQRDKSVPLKMRYLIEWDDTVCWKIMLFIYLSTLSLQNENIISEEFISYHFILYAQIRVWSVKGVNHQCVVSQCPTVSQCDGVGRLVVCLLYDYDLYGLLPDGHCCQVTAILSPSQ